MHGGPAHGNVELQRGITGDAHFLADQPFGVHLKMRLPARETRRQRHVTIDEGLALVAIIGQRPDGQPRRCRPADVRIAGTLRPLQHEAGGKARVAGVAPVGVPVGIVPQPQPHPEGLARHHLGGIGNQLHLQRTHPLRAGFPVGGCRLAPRRRRPCGRSRRGPRRGRGLCPPLGRVAGMGRQGRHGPQQGCAQQQGRQHGGSTQGQRPAERVLHRRSGKRFVREVGTRAQNALPRW